MRRLQVVCIALAAIFAAAIIYPISILLDDEPLAINGPQIPPTIVSAKEGVDLRGRAQTIVAETQPINRPQTAPAATAEQQQVNVADAESVSVADKDQARIEQGSRATTDLSPASMPSKQDLTYLAYYAYSEALPDKKPADTVLESLKDVPVGTPLEEVVLASDAFGLDVTFMKAVAKIESDFDPKQRTGSYIGLFQLSNYEFDRFGSGDITDPRDNAIAAAYKFATAAILFEIDTHKKPTLNDLYLIHQQGWQGAAEHVAHPQRIAWKSMCATDEGHEKGEKWCKRAVWQNTLPSVRSIWKTVDNLTSGAFIEMWRSRIDEFYARYSQAAAK